MSLTIQPNNVFFKSIAPVVEKRINEINRNVKNLIKNIAGLNISLCCKQCNAKNFQEIINRRERLDQEIHRVINQTDQVAKKYLLSLKQRALLNHSIRDLVSSRQVLKRKFESISQICLRGLVKEAFLKRESSWTQILPCAAIFGVGAAVSHPFRLGMLAGLVDYTFAVASMFFYLKYFPPSSSAMDSEDNKRETHSWTQTLSYIVAAGAGCAISRSIFNAGIPAELIYSTFAMTAISFCLKKMLPSPSFYNSNLFVNALFKPLSEEGMFRGVIQKVVCYVTNSPLAGIVVSAGLFGASHLENDHNLKVFQSVSAGFSGLLYGTMNYKLGLAASFGAHAMNNLLACK